MVELDGCLKELPGIEFGKGRRSCIQVVPMFYSALLQYKGGLDGAEYMTLLTDFLSARIVAFRMFAGNDSGFVPGYGDVPSCWFGMFIRRGYLMYFWKWQRSKLSERRRLNYLLQ